MTPEPEFEHVAFAIPPYDDEVQCTEKWNGVHLGGIRYYKKLSVYVYDPSGDQYHTAECLRDIAGYLEWLNGTLQQ
jgi:hypothetical protein